MEEFRVLLVDDERSLLLTVGANLELAGFHVTTVETPERALTLIDDERFDLVLSDIRMPGMNGVELFRRIRKRRPEIPVVLMTAFALETLVQEAIQEGAFTVLPKPFDVDRVLPVLMRAIKRSFVLIVDDEQSQALAAAESLSACGVRARAVVDCESAVAAIREGNVDVCVIDLVMPDVDGAAMVERVRAIDPTIACIAISGHDVPEMIRGVMARGAFTFMRKPIATGELVRTIASARSKRAR